MPVKCKTKTDARRQIITSAIEHKSVLESCRRLERHGWQLTVLPVDGFGQVNPADVAASLCGDTVLVSVMIANNEVGTIQRVTELDEAIDKLLAESEKEKQEK